MTMIGPTEIGSARTARRARHVASSEIVPRPGGAPEHLYREIVAAYLAGTERITLREAGGLRATTRNVALTFRRRVCATARLEATSEELVLSDLDPGDRAGLATLTFRLGEEVLRLLRRAGDAIPELDRPESWEALDDPIDALAWTIHRHVALRCVAGPIEPRRDEGRIDPIGWLEASRALERIGDHAVQIGAQASTWRSAGALPDERRLVAEFHAQTSDFVARALVLLGDPRPDAANEALDLGEALQATSNSLLERLVPGRSLGPAPAAASVLALGRVLDSLARIVAYSRDIVEVSLDHARPAFAARKFAELPERAPPPGTIGGAA